MPLSQPLPGPVTSNPKFSRWRQVLPSQDIQGSVRVNCPRDSTSGVLSPCHVGSDELSAAATSASLCGCASIREGVNEVGVRCE